MGKFFIKVLHEEPLDKLTLETIKGGDFCVCNLGSTFTCKCYGTNTNPCTCLNGSSYECLEYKLKPIN